MKLLTQKQMKTLLNSYTLLQKRMSERFLCHKKKLYIICANVKIPINTEYKFFMLIYIQVILRIMH